MYITIEGLGEPEMLLSFTIREGASVKLEALLDLEHRSLSFKITSESKMQKIEHWCLTISDAITRYNQQCSEWFNERK
jgi:hypothetical protein